MAVTVSEELASGARWSLPCRVDPIGLGRISLREYERRDGGKICILDLMDVGGGGGEVWEGGEVLEEGRSWREGGFFEGGKVLEEEGTYWREGRFWREGGRFWRGDDKKNPMELWT